MLYLVNRLDKLHSLMIAFCLDCMSQLDTNIHENVLFLEDSTIQLGMGNLGQENKAIFIHDLSLPYDLQYQTKRN